MKMLLVDHNMEGQALLLWDTLEKAGWVDLLEMILVMFRDAGLPENSDDQEVWRFAQAKQMFLLTGNRGDYEPDPLERTIRAENTPDSLPVLTVGNVDRLKKDRIYRERCAARIAEILLDLENHLGTALLFIP